MVLIGEVALMGSGMNGKWQSVVMTGEVDVKGSGMNGKWHLSAFGITVVWETEFCDINFQRVL